jgi:hypothetical protein
MDYVYKLYREKIRNADDEALLHELLQIYIFGKINI